MKAIQCQLVCNTKNGYCLQPIICNSIKEAVKTANDMNMAYRIFDMNGNFIKGGW